MMAAVPFSAVAAAAVVTVKLAGFKYFRNWGGGRNWSHLMPENGLYWA